MNTANIYKTDFLDILFEGRNKDYGAYDLRRSEDKRVRKALIGTASIALMIVGGYVLGNSLHTPAMTNTRNIIITDTLMNIPPPMEKELVPPPPAPPTPPPPAVSSIRLATPTITPDEMVSTADEVPPRDSIGNKAVGLTTTQGDDTNGSDVAALVGGTGVGTGVIESSVGGDGEEPPRVWVEIMPTFPGGDAALMKFLQNNVKYPHVAQESDISGNVFVHFIVDKYGNISDITTVGAHVGGGLEEEAIRVVKKMPAWKPGRQNGQNVAVQFNLPIRFTLAN